MKIKKINIRLAIWGFLSGLFLSCLSDVCAAALPDDGTRKFFESSFDEKRFWDTVTQNPLSGLEDTDTAGKKIALVIGNTGAGKSTTINYLLGHRMKTCSSEDSDSVFAPAPEVVVDDIDKEKGPEIGHSISSCTDFCKTYFNWEFVYVDTPGFSDSRGLERRVYNQLATKFFIQDIGRVDAVLVVVESSEFTAGRGKAFVELLRELSLMMDRLGDTYMPNIFWCITKLPKPGTSREQLVKSFEKRFLSRALDKITELASGIMYDRKKVLTDLVHCSQLFPIYPLDGGYSSRVLLNEVKASSADPIPADLFALKVPSMDIHGLTLSLFSNYYLLEKNICGFFLSILEGLEEDVSLLLLKVEEFDTIRRGLEESSEACKERIALLVEEKREGVQAIKEEIFAYGDLEEVAYYATIDTDPSSSGGYFFSATMTATYTGIPFSRADSKVGNVTCEFSEVICEPEDGRWVVCFTTPTPETRTSFDEMVKAGVKAGGMLGGGVGGVAGGLVGAGVGAGVFAGAAAGAERVAEAEILAGAKAGAGAGAAVGGAAGAAVGGAAGSGVGLLAGGIMGGLSLFKHVLFNERVDFSPTLEVWSPKKHIYASAIDALNKQMEDTESRIEELVMQSREQSSSEKKEAGERMAVVQSESNELLTKIEASYRDLDAKREIIAENTHALEFLEKISPLLNQDRMKAFGSITGFTKKYQAYKKRRAEEGGLFGGVRASLRKVVACEGFMVEDLSLSEFLKKVTELDETPAVALSDKEETLGEKGLLIDSISAEISSDCEAACEE